MFAGHTGVFFFKKFVSQKGLRLKNIKRNEVRRMESGSNYDGGRSLCIILYCRADRKGVPFRSEQPHSFFSSETAF